MTKIITQEESKQIQLELLDKFSQFCKSNNLRYSLCGGTLMGAVRHKGFIPWDDDIDVMMPRPDYQVFLQKFEGTYSDISLLHYLKGKRYHLAFAKISDNRTSRKGYEEIGVFIDVFPIDGVPSDESELEKFLNKKATLLSRNYEIYYFNNPEFRKTKYSFFRRMKSYIKNKLFLPSWENAVKEYDDFISSYEFETASIAVGLGGRYKKGDFNNVSIFKEYTELLFEGKMYPCIKDYDTYLKNRYGDYMQLPPIEQRIPGHAHEVYWK